MNLLIELQQRNALLYWFGWLCLLGSLICIALIFTTTLQVNNTNAFLKPMKFFLSVWIFCWSMGWILHQLQQPRQTYYYSIATILILTFELLVITWQAANGRLSHFNSSNTLYASLFSLMGIAISLLVIYTFIIGLSFWKLNAAGIDAGYIWGIRLGIIIFTIFSFEGAIMGAKLRHTIGAADGSDGIAILNWSKQYGDLRIAHFFGMHALQLLPLLGYYLFKQPFAIILVSFLYALLVSIMLIKALMGFPIM